MLPKFLNRFLRISVILFCHSLLIFFNNNCNNVYGFNLSPKPNIIFKEPNLPTSMPKVQSSYFGFSLNLRTNSVLVGAPRAQSTLDTQKTINETGAIYRCSFESTQCIPYNFDLLGNLGENHNGFTFDMETKDYQWLGMSMDGGPLETDNFVVCTPRVIADVGLQHLMQGLCYTIANTTTQQPDRPMKIAALRLRDKLYLDSQTKQVFYHAFGEQGVSVHMSDNGDEILIGAPGIYNWRGSVVRFRKQLRDDVGGLSKRDIHGSGGQREKRNTYEYAWDVPNPALWQQPEDSYFGYAVASGYFQGPAIKNHSLLYLASAPQANSQQGEAYIFDIVTHFSSDKAIKIIYTFSGNQMGEFFGYALVADDFIGRDGYDDVAITAPFYGKRSGYDNGAVYIFRNKGVFMDGQWSGNFDLVSVLTTTFEGPGRFGTAISRIGDINQDGYNDLAIGAPYEENGVVYIYLGGANNVALSPSQKLVAPVNSITEPPLSPFSLLPQAFGHGLSKGSDIDNNKYIDIAVGAPNAETIYVYKAYPVAKVIPIIKSSLNVLQASDSTFDVEFCWLLTLTHPITFDTGINITLQVDQHNGRAVIDGGINQLEMTKRADAEQKCSKHTVHVTFSLNDIFKPIDIKMQFKILDTVPDSEVFCPTCVAINPLDSTFIESKLAFSTGCKDIICISDLIVTGSLQNIKEPYIIGSTESVTIGYTIENKGEKAYLPQINIKLGEFTTLVRIPWNCKTISGETIGLLCDLNGGSPLDAGETTYMEFVVDSTKFIGLYAGTFKLMSAEVTSSGHEQNPIDNFAELSIKLAEFSEIEITGKSSAPLLNLEDGLRLENITHLFEIRNNGPTNIQQLDVNILIPTQYVDDWTLELTTVTDYKSIGAKVQYNNQFLDIEWIQNYTTILAPLSIGSSPFILATDFSANGMGYDTSKIGFEYDLNTPPPLDDEYGRRRRRNLPEVNFRGFNPNFNRYTQTLREHQRQHSISKRSVVYHDDSIIESLPINRTILFDCRNEGAMSCITLKFHVNNFKTENSAILVRLNFSIDLHVIDKIITEKRDILLFKTLAEVTKVNDENGDTINVIQLPPYTVISKYVIVTTPIWIWIVSAICGLLALIIITYVLYRCGFFNRAKKDELNKIKRESQAINRPEETEDED